MSEYLGIAVCFVLAGGIAAAIEQIVHARIVHRQQFVRTLQRRLNRLVAKLMIQHKWIQMLTKDQRRLRKGVFRRNRPVGVTDETVALIAGSAAVECILTTHAAGKNWHAVAGHWQPKDSWTGERCLCRF